MTVKEKIAKATQVLNSEGYKVDHKMMVFGLFQEQELERDVIKSFMRINSKCNYSYSPDEIKISFSLGIKKIDEEVNTTKDNRRLASYINYLCDVVDQLNNLNIVLKRDLSELEM